VAGSDGPRGTEFFKNTPCGAFRQRPTPRVVASRSCRSPPVATILLTAYWAYSSPMEV
jgi:hypothetical protein